MKGDGFLFVLLFIVGLIIGIITGIGDMLSCERAPPKEPEDDFDECEILG